MSTITHPHPVSAGGTFDRPPVSRYDNDSRVGGDRVDGFTVTAPDATYYVRPNRNVGWDIYLGDGLELLPVAGGGQAVGIPHLDDAIGALIGDAEARS